MKRVSIVNTKNSSLFYYEAKNLAK